MQGLAVGDPEFDEVFVIKGNDDEKIRDLFANPKIQRMIQDQPKLRLEVRDNEGWFGPKFPQEVDKPHFRVVGVINNVTGSNPCSTCAPQCWIDCAGLGRRTKRMRESNCDAPDRAEELASGVSPAKSEAVVADAVRRGIPVTVR
jgi:hypothetical protein